MVIELDFFENEINGLVEGSEIKPYNVALYIESTNHFIRSECECQFGGHCKHEAAVIYSIIHDQYLLSAKGIKEKGKIFDEKNTNVFRKMEWQGDFHSTLQAYMPAKNYELEWYKNVHGIIVNDEEVEISTINRNSYYVSLKPEKIILKNKDDMIWVKCLTCNKTDTKLCLHQATLLSEMAFSLDMAGFGYPGFSIPLIKNEASENLDLEVNTIDKYFDLVLVKEGIAAQAKSNVVAQSWLEEINMMYNDTQQYPSLEEGGSSTTSVVDARPKKHALLWNLAADDYPYLTFISGYAYKTKKKGILGSDREEKEFPDNIPTAYHDIGRQLKLIELREQVDKRFDAAYKLLNDNIELLNNIYQYITKENRYDNGKSKWKLFEFSTRPLDCSFTCNKIDNYIHLTRHISVGGKNIDYKLGDYSSLLFTIINDRAYLHKSKSFFKLMFMFEDHDTIIFQRHHKDLFYLIQNLEKEYEIEMGPDVLPEQIRLSNPEYQIFLREIDGHVLFEPNLIYDDKVYNPLTHDVFYHDGKIYQPDSEEVTFFKDFLTKSHPKFDTKEKEVNHLLLDFKSLLNDHWFMNFAETCEAMDIRLLGQTDFKQFKYSTKKAVTATHVKSGIDWFDVNVDLSFGKEKIKETEWIRALKNKETFVTLKDGSLGVLPAEWIAQMEKILAVSEVKGGSISISKYRFNIIDELFTHIDDEMLSKEVREKKKKLSSYNFDKKHRIPKSINAELRDYQKHGYQWLRFLDDNDFGGILADDMGLGKTLEVICLLANQKGKGKGTSLIIVPRTLLFNWGTELDKFCNRLSYVVHHGSGRERELSNYKKFDLVISTYDTVASDIEQFRIEAYNYIILDESQAIKNPDSQRYKAVRLLQSRNKLAMTGTPIENNTMDLYAQLSFTSPGLLGNRSHFRSHFAIPIDNNRDASKAELLRKMTHPFILRRTKDQVAKDLPDKTESVIYCEMGDAQRKLYDNLKEKLKQDIYNSVETKGVAKSKFQILEGLLRLRQMCNSPLLVNPSFQGSSAESVKINMLCQHLTENIKNHSILIFSQFVKLLTLVRKELDQMDIPYAYLDGSTRKRMKEVDKFMNNEDVNVFLISIKAGNTGLNLTKADYVYILDPWWNPAVESQAIDRTHRIGQDKRVFAYRLICKDSIEEKIMKLQERKKELAQNIIQVDENIMKTLKKDELMALFD